mmetsp:Transcript_3752/g.6401  ORF Transcript_3752/g.6401 Transcript_3752/m.6401 type:complete len:120 (-) Transcript_3752:87-446(-)
MYSGLFASPFIALTFFTTDNFNVSITMLAFNYLIAECWASPTITMLQDTTKNSNQGFAINSYLLFATLCGALSTFLLDRINYHFDTDNNPQIFGDALAGLLLFSYLGSVPFFWLAGRAY